MTKRGLLFAAGLAVALGVYFAVSLHGLGEAGLFRDEAAGPLVAADMVRRVPTQAYLTVGFLGREWPVMEVYYQGAVEAYTYLPLFHLMGPSVFSFRLTNVLGGALVLLAFFWCAWMLFDGPTAALACLLLALDPTFIFSVRHDRAAINLLLLCDLAGMMMMLKALSSRSRAWFAAACLVMGLALWVRAIAVWYEIGLLAAVLAIRFADLREVLKTGRAYLAGLAAFAIGGSPFFLYTLCDPVILSEMAKTDIHHPPTLDMAGTVAKHLALAWSTLDEVAIQQLCINAYHRVAPLGVIALAALAYAGWSWRRARGGLADNPRSTGFLAVFLAFSLAACVLTPPVWGAHHIVIAVYPFVHLLAAAFLITLWRRGAGWDIAACVALLLQAGLSLSNDAFMLSSFSSNDVNPIFSRAIYSLADYAVKSKPAKIVCLDWGFYESLEFLTGLPVERAENVASHRDSEGYWKSLMDEHDLFLLYSKPVDSPHSGDVFLREAARLHRKVDLKRRFFLKSTTDTDATIDVYSVAKR